MPVLNAFRHHRIDHHVIAPAAPRAGVCSTPFGITESITRGAEKVTTPPTSAQRLSASPNRSPLCLTQPRLAWHVLNAFRHHRIDHDRMAVRQ